MHPGAEMIDMDAEPSLADILAADPAISSHSRWSDPIWRLDGESGGQTAINFAIHWTVKAPKRLIDEAKLLAALLFLERDGERTLGHSTAGTFSAGIRHLLRFMGNYAYSSFAELDEDAFRLFRDNLAVKLSDPEWYVEEFTADSDDLDAADDAEDAAEAIQTELELGDEPANGKGPGEAKAEKEGETDVFTRAAAYYRLRTWRQLVECGPAMEKAGARPLAYDPYATTSLKECVQKASSVASFLIPPLPDKVALRIMAKAQTLMGAPADDVVELQRRYVGCLARLDREPTTTERRMLQSTMEGFEFSKMDGRPWRDRIVLPPDRPGGGIEMRKLIGLIRDAAVLVIFCGTGMRIGEMCSIIADPAKAAAPLPLFGDQPTTERLLPFCVSTRPSKTRLNEHLFVHGRLFKNERTPRDETWLIGSRPADTDVEVPVLRALRVLERLYEPWRALATDERTRGHLILGMRGSGLPRSGGNVAPIRSGHLRLSLREFIADNCGLDELAPDVESDPKLRPYVDKKGRCIRPHQWRKTFALYMMKVDDRMVPALAHHFKHMSIAVTENSYMPKDASMLAAGESVHAQEASRWFYEQRHGAGGSFGRLDEIMAEHRAEWEKLVEDLPFEDGLPQVMRFCMDRDIRIFHAEHGRCVIGANPDQARCHEAAGTSSWRNSKPNHMARTPGLCTGCTNFSVSTEHAGFWRKRYVSNETSWLLSDRSPQFRVVQKRAQQAAAVLKALQVPLPIVLAEAPTDRAARKRRSIRNGSPSSHPDDASNQGGATA